MRIRLILVDRHRITREGLRTLLAAVPEIEVVAEADDGRRALELVERHRPEIVVTELALPALNGIETTRQITANWSEVRVLALSHHLERRYVTAALTAGAAGYVPKTCGFDEVLRAIRALHRGDHYISPAVTKTVLDGLLSNADVAAIGDPALTPREREVLQLLAEGSSTKEIAGALQVSPKTVETHRRQIIIKLNLHSVAELTRYAVSEGISPL